MALTHLDYRFDQLIGIVAQEGISHERVRKALNLNKCHLYNL